MKKIRKQFVLVCLCFLLGACSQEVNVEEARAEQYKSYIQAIVDNEYFLSTNEAENYNIYAVLNEVADGKYRYDIILDDPRVAMHEVQIIAIEKDILGTLRDDRLMPSLGILEEDSYTLIPNQVNVSKGYPQGLVISGMTDVTTVYLQVMVVWKNSSKFSQNRDFYNLQATYEVKEDIE